MAGHCGKGRSRPHVPRLLQLREIKQGSQREAKKAPEEKRTREKEAAPAPTSAGAAQGDGPRAGNVLPGWISHGDGS